MYEYEFRITVSTDKDTEWFLNRFPDANPVLIVYAKPHFRWRHNQWETKKKLRSVVTFFDGLWFKLVESKETPFNQWKKKTHKEFIQSVALTQNPFQFENRMEIHLESDAKLFYFHKEDKSRGITFELEIGTFLERWKTMNCTHLVDQLSPFKEMFHILREHPHPFTYTLKPCVRKPVKVKPESSLSKDMLIAQKYDGVFGFIHSYPDRLCEYWEGNERCVKRGISLGDGLVFGAERMKDGTVILLDVYQVRGLRTEGRKYILTEFLPQISLPEGYQVQCYYSSMQDVVVPYHETDGFIFHDTETDRIYKQKTIHTVDLVYLNGYFQLPHGKRLKCPEVVGMEDGIVYEIDMRNDKVKVLKRRNDRFTGNTEKQLKAIYKKIRR